MKRTVVSFIIRPLLILVIDTAITLCAAAQTYTVTLDKQGGTGGTDQVTATLHYPLPFATAPAKENFVFAGYYDATEGGTQYYTSAMAGTRDWDKEANTTLYARWITLPASFSWGNAYGNNWLSTPKNQGGCGACWAFSLAASYEARKRIIENNPSLMIDLSEQHMVSCWAGNCNGGGTAEHLNRFRDEGVPDEACFPYASSTGTPPPCSSGCADWATRAYRIDRWTALSNATAVQIKNQIIVNGPVYALMDLYSDLYSYSSGVYVRSSGTPLGTKAVIIYGWDDANDCWLVVNTWGTSWGETGPGGTRGFFRVKITGNNCNFAKLVYVLTPKRNPVLIFSTPATQSTNILFTKIEETQAQLTWTPGNGMGRAVFLKQASSGTPAPVNFTTYIAVSSFGSGSQIGTTGWYCVYNGTGSSVTITGITPDVSYTAMVCEYNGIPGKEQYNSSTDTGNPVSFTVTNIGDFVTGISGIRIYPQPFSERLTIENASDLKLVTITNLSGQKIRSVKNNGAGTITIPADNIGAGVFILNMQKADGRQEARLIIKTNR